MAYYSSFLVFLLLVKCISASAVTMNSSYAGCATKRPVLLRALFETGDNLIELDRIFYPERDLPSRFITVNYHFLDSDGSKDDCEVTYYWASGGFLLLQPPTIFIYTSLLFSHPANTLTDMNLALPYDCRELVMNVTEDGNCSCINPVLDRLTQQVKLS